MLIYKKTETNKNGIIHENSSWEFDGYILKHGRWDFNCIIDGKHYTRVYTEKGILYNYPYEGAIKTIITDSSKNVKTYLNGVETALTDY